MFAVCPSLFLPWSVFKLYSKHASPLVLPSFIPALRIFCRSEREAAIRPLLGCMLRVYSTSTAAVNNLGFGLGFGVGAAVALALCVGSRVWPFFQLETQT